MNILIETNRYFKMKKNLNFKYLFKIIIENCLKMIDWEESGY